MGERLGIKEGQALNSSNSSTIYQPKPKPELPTIQHQWYTQQN